MPMSEILGDIWHAFWATFRQLFHLAGPGLVLAVVMHYVSRAVEQRACTLLGEETYLLLFGAIGTAVHEAGHACFCVMFGHRIVAIRLFESEPADGRWGYVRHSYNPRNLYHQAGNFFIGIGPILLGAVILSGFARYQFGAEATDLTSVLIPHAWDLSSPVNAVETAHDAMAQLLALLSWTSLVDGLADWRFYVFAYLAFSVGSAVSLSPKDIRTASRGFAIISGMLFVANLISVLLIGSSLSRFIALLTSYHSAFYAMMAVALALNLLMLAVLSLTAWFSGR
jgi:hypothetical protein